MNNSLKIFILSPHIDDAAFGLAVTISKLADNKILVTIINCFTITKWTAITVANKDTEAVSLLRKNEDAEFYKAVNSNIKIINLDLLDAPLRNGYIFQEKPFEQNELDLVEDLQKLLEQHVNGLLFCPLGIGNHIDHAICRAAVLKQYNKLQVLFYEDLPYAQRITGQQINLHIKELEQELAVNLTSYTSFVLNSNINKEQMIRLYKTQMNDEIASEIIARLDFLKGERIWGEKGIIKDLISLLPGDNSIQKAYKG